MIPLKGPVPPDEAARFNAHGADMGGRPNAEQLKRVADLPQGGTFNITVTNIYPLELVSDAHAQIEKGHTRGKIVLTVP